MPTRQDGVIVEQVNDEDVLLMLDYPKYFDLLDVPLPDGRANADVVTGKLDVRETAANLPDELHSASSKIRTRPKSAVFVSSKARLSETGSSRRTIMKNPGSIA